MCFIPPPLAFSFPFFPLLSLTSLSFCPFPTQTKVRLPLDQPPHLDFPPRLLVVQRWIPPAAGSSQMCNALPPSRRTLTKGSSSNQHKLRILRSILPSSLSAGAAKCFSARPHLPKTRPGAPCSSLPEHRLLFWETRQLQRFVQRGVRWREGRSPASSFGVLDPPLWTSAKTCRAGAPRAGLEADAPCAISDGGFSSPSVLGDAGSGFWKGPRCGIPSAFSMREFWHLATLRWEISSPNRGFSPLGFRKAF